jgi:acyl-CoA-binding protein
MYYTSQQDVFWDLCRQEKWANLGGKLEKMAEMAQEWMNLVNQLECSLRDRHSSLMT